MTVLNWGASIFFRQRFPIKICFAMLIYLQHASLILQNILKRKSKLNGSCVSKTKGFQLSFENSSVSDNFLNFFEPSCTASEIFRQATNFLLCSSFLWLLLLEMHYSVIAKISGGSRSNNFKLLIFRLFAFWVSLPSTGMCWQSFSPTPIFITSKAHRDF